jgi:hypothetical protein
MNITVLKLGSFDFNHLADFAGKTRANAFNDLAFSGKTPRSPARRVRPDHPTGAEQ